MLDKEIMVKASLLQPNDFNIKDTIVVVSGLPRSGTSMLMNMLEAGGMTLLRDDIRAADENNPKGYFEYERVKKLADGDVDWLPKARGKAVKIISYLLFNLPDTYNYRIIFMQRKLTEIIASQRKMLIDRGENPNKIGEDELEIILKKHLNQVDEWISQQSNIKRIDVNYNRMIENPEADIRQLSKFLGNSLDVGIMAQVIDPSLYRQRS